MLLVDREVRVLDANPRSERLVENSVVNCLNAPGGSYLRCARRHDSPDGCGHGPACQNCVLRRSVREVADGGEPVYDRDLEVVVERGTEPVILHLKVGASPVQIDGQRQVVVALYDVTAWHLTEQLYRTLFNEMGYGFLLFETVRTDSAGLPDFTVTAANPALLNLLGKHPDRLTGRLLRDVLTDLPDDFLAVLDGTLHTGEAAHCGFHLPSQDKHFEGTVFRPTEGQVAVIFTDVTDRKRAESQVRYERNLLYALMDNQPDRIFFKDADLRFIQVSKEQARALGLASAAEAVGKTLDELAPGEASRTTMRREREILRSGMPLRAQMEKTQDHQGKTHWDSVSKAPIRDAEGALIGIVGIVRDITPEIELQQQLQQATKMDAIGRLAGGVAHDFNNLLQAILGYTELLLTGVDEKDPQHDDLKQIERAARRATDLTRQLLMFSCKQRVEPQAIDLNQIILSTENMLKRLMGETIDIVLSLEPDLKPVLADPSQLEQILLNLAVNAKDAMPQGGRLTFRTGMKSIGKTDAASHPESRPGLFTCLTVSDTGSGIAPDLLPHLFEPFFTTKERGKGTGLGLSVIYGIVKQSGGWITVTSAKGRGSSFEIFLPASDLSPSGPDEGKQPPEGQTTLPGLGKTILLVEDEPGVRNLAALTLQSAGYRVFACEGAQKAKAVFARERDGIHLLFSDVVLLGQNGIDLALELRGSRPQLPILLCSGYADDTVRWDSIRQEGFHFLPKPYPITKLLAAVRDALSDRPLKTKEVNGG
jgi:PAS domain S-box-containing protein